MSPQAPASLVGTACAVLAAELLDELRDWSEEHVRACRTFIQRQQRDDGWFEDPLLRPAPGNSLDQEYLLGHSTFLSIMALDVLGGRPLRALRFLAPWRDDDAVFRFADGLDWTQPWRESNWVEWIGYWLLADAGVTAADVPLRDGSLPKGVAGVLRWLEARQDRETGFWGNPPFSGPERLLHLMAGAYHHFVFYYATGRPVPGHERIVDVTLDLQQPDGLFAPGRIGGGPCEDLDAVDILANMHRLREYRRRDIETSLERAATALVANQRSDGAFVHHVGDHDVGCWRAVARTLFQPRLRPGPGTRIRKAQAVWRSSQVGSLMHYGGCPALPFFSRGGDMFSHWFRPLALALCAVVLGPERSPVWWRFGFRRQITQGWWPGEVRGGQARKPLAAAAA